MVVANGMCMKQRILNDIQLLSRVSWVMKNGALYKSM